AILVPNQLMLVAGKCRHAIQWRSARLGHTVRKSDWRPPEAAPPAAAPPPVAAYDIERFGRTTTAGPLKAVADGWGQVLLFRDDALVAAFLVRGTEIAGWLPDGTFWGATGLLGCAA